MTSSQRELVPSVGGRGVSRRTLLLGSAASGAVAILVVTAEWSRVPAARVLVTGAIAGIVVASTLIAVDGLWNRPYRTSGHDASTTQAPDVPALDSVRLTPEAAKARLAA